MYTCVHPRPGVRAARAGPMAARQTVSIIIIVIIVIIVIVVVVVIIIYDIIQNSVLLLYVSISFERNVECGMLCLDVSCNIVNITNIALC